MEKVLKPNGVMRLAVPDFFFNVLFYINKSFPLKKFLGPLYGKMSMNGKNIYHKTVYDYKSIKKF